MQKTLSRTELEAQLEGKSESISRRLDALQDEIGGLSLRQMTERRPWTMLAGAVAGGLLLGWMIGGIGKGRGGRSSLHADLVDGYINSISDDVRRLSRRGKDASDAVREALRDRVPVIVVSSDDEHSTRGTIRQVVDLGLKAAAGFAVKSALDYAASRVNIEQLVNQIVDEAEPASNGTALDDVAASPTL